MTLFSSRGLVYATMGEIETQIENYWRGVNTYHTGLCPRPVHRLRILVWWVRVWGVCPWIGGGMGEQCAEEG